MSIYAQIYDSDGAFTTHQIVSSLIVTPDLSDIQTIIDKLTSADPYYSVNVILNQGLYLKSLQEIQTISSLLNEQSISDKLGLLLNGSSILFPQVYGSLANFSGVNAVSKIINPNRKIF